MEEFRTRTDRSLIAKMLEWNRFKRINATYALEEPIFKAWKGSTHKFVPPFVPAFTGTTIQQQMSDFGKYNQTILDV